MSMKTEKLSMSKEFPISPIELYKSWLNAHTHSEFTGAETHIKEELNSDYTTWDEYISGKIIALEPGRKILHTWRTTEFKNSDADSQVEILLEDNCQGGTILTLNHWDIPEGESEKYRDGWEQYYFEPMTEFFNALITK